MSVVFTVYIIILVFLFCSRNVKPVFICNKRQLIFPFLDICDGWIHCIRYLDLCISTRDRESAEGDRDFYSKFTIVFIKLLLSDLNYNCLTPCIYPFTYSKVSPFAA